MSQDNRDRYAVPEYKSGRDWLQQIRETLATASRTTERAGSMIELDAIEANARGMSQSGYPVIRIMADDLIQLVQIARDLAAND